MTIHVDKEREWDPFVKEVMAKFKELEEKIDLIKSNTELQLKNIKKVK
ncbi:MAG: hypothetical protein H8D39_03100 [Candidatus Atribacteria bacterium]|nr:hypothetical protein [Candidatus Atribacteria bacterium]